jgi:hypothetical protein
MTKHRKHAKAHRKMAQPAHIDVPTHVDFYEQEIATCHTLARRHLRSDNPFRESVVAFFVFVLMAALGYKLLNVAADHDSDLAGLGFIFSACVCFFLFSPAMAIGYYLMAITLSGLGRLGMPIPTSKFAQALMIELALFSSVMLIVFGALAFGAIGAYRVLNMAIDGTRALF